MDDFIWENESYQGESLQRHLVHGVSDKTFFLHSRYSRIVLRPCVFGTTHTNPFYIENT